MSYAQLLETYKPNIVHNHRFKNRVINRIKLERPGWIPAHITENWDTDPFAYQTEEELMPAGGLHGQLLTYFAEMLRIPLKKQGLMLLIDTFLLYRDSNNVRQRIGPDLLLMEDCFPAPSAYDLDTRPPPRCVIETTSPKSHYKDLKENVAFYFSLGIETYFVIDAVTPQKKLRTPIELHLWRKGKPPKKVKVDNTGYFLLPEMNVKIASQREGLIFVDAMTGNALRDNGQLNDALEESEQRADTEKQRADTEAQRADTEAQRADVEVQRATIAEQRAKTAFENGEQKRQIETASKMLAKGYDLAEIAELIGLSLDELVTLSAINLKRDKT